MIHANSGRAVQGKQALQKNRATARASAAHQPAATVTLSAEALQPQGESNLSPGFLAALSQGLRSSQLPPGSHALMRGNVEQALRLRHMSQGERRLWLQAQVGEGGPMDYQQGHPEGSSERLQAQRLCGRNCGAVGAALGLRSEDVLRTALLQAADESQVMDGFRESQAYLNGEPSQLGQRGRRKFEQPQSLAATLAARAGSDPLNAYRAMQEVSAPERSKVALALARHLQLGGFDAVPRTPEGDFFLDRLRRQLVTDNVGLRFDQMSPEAAMLSQQVAVARARRAGSLP